MKPLLRWMVLVLAVSPTAIARAQTAPSSEAPQAPVVLAKLAPPVYPLAAWLAGINGVVQMRVGIRRDGSLASADLVSGHALLGQAALESLRNSEYQCSDCSEEVTEHTLTFNFEFRESKECSTEAPGKPTLTISQDVVTVAAPVHCVITDTRDPASAFRKRSAKCLYLWACGRR